MINGLSVFRADGNWFKGNLHTHTTRSDGPLSPADTADRYAELGYDFISITDHGLRADVARDDPSFVVLPGAELHPFIPWRKKQYHIVVPRLPRDFPVERGSGDLADAMAELTSRGIPFLIAHPYWCGNDLFELLPLAPLSLGVEILNATCRRIGRGVSNAQLDDLLSRGFALSAIAVDDVHNDDEFGIGWIVVKATALSADAVMAAIVAGDFYSSSGPAIRDFSFNDGRLSIEADPVRTISFVGTCELHSVGASVSAGPGETITRAEFQIPDGFSGYVRGECATDHLIAAWTNPVFFADGVPLD